MRLQMDVMHQFFANCFLCTKNNLTNSYMLKLVHNPPIHSF